ncbi:MAG: hypothetical protein SFY92_03465 [Verrucomicrobiae bacterium]|nr:hypothetical protein [Verrucomicrobiae bacterium]
MSSRFLKIPLGALTLHPEIRDGRLHSIGAVTAGKTHLRNQNHRFLPWFDTYQGDVFDSFVFRKLQKTRKGAVLHLTALSNSDYPFRERRDSSGDTCLREANWDAKPLSIQFRICLESAAAEVDGRSFSGFKYWFEFESKEVKVHRILDRQTWEVGGDLEDVTINIRNWLTPPSYRVTKKGAYSTVGLNEWTGLLPGNLWARWSLLPAFDLQYGRKGVITAWFDRVSLIRTVVESNKGEDCLRHVDIHYFADTHKGKTNPKTVLYCPDRLDEIDTLNLWTRLHDQERDKSRRQFGIKKDGPPKISVCKNIWLGVRYPTAYTDVVDFAAEIDADYAFVDPPWQNMQAFNDALEAAVPEEKRKGTILEKYFTSNMCATLEFKIADEFGGEKGLKELCDYAMTKGIKVISWIAAHYTPFSYLRIKQEGGHGKGGIFAMRESGLHPDTGYAGDCWPVNLNTPHLKTLKNNILDACKRTGLAGFLWDSFSNLGWWQLDYSKGDMRPQFEGMMEMYSDWTNAGLYLMPEAICAFSSHSCLSLFGGDVYRGHLLGYTYDSVMGFAGHEPFKVYDEKVLMGEEPIDILFECYAHKRIPNTQLWRVPKERRNPAAFAAMRKLNTTYKLVRDHMEKRTVLKGHKGVLWEGPKGAKVFFCFKNATLKHPVTDAFSGETCPDGRVTKNNVYFFE